jgi:hypothetical protein
MTHPKKPKGV